MSISDQVKQSIEIFGKIREMLIHRRQQSAGDFAEYVRWKLVVANYYADLARDFENKATDQMESNLKSSKEMLVTKWDGRVIDFCLRSEAHTMCCAQVLHSSADLYAQLLNATILALNQVEFSEENVYAHVVSDRIKGLNSATYGALSGSFEALLASTSFKLFAGVCNTIKHRKLLKTQWSELFDFVNQKEKTGLAVKPFEYRGKPYNNLWADSIYDQGREEIIVALGDSGNELLKLL